MNTIVNKKINLKDKVSINQIQEVQLIQQKVIKNSVYRMKIKLLDMFRELKYIYMEKAKRN